MTLRERLTQSDILLAPGCYDALSALLAQEAGAEAGLVAATLARSGFTASIAAQSSSSDARNFTFTPFAASHSASAADQGDLAQAVPT